MTGEGIPEYTATRSYFLFQAPEFRACKIKGTNGVISWNSVDNEVKLYNNKKRKWEVVFRAKNFERNEMYVDEIKHFLKCVKSRKNTINNIEEGVTTLNIALTMKKSAKMKKMIKI